MIGLAHTVGQIAVRYQLLPLTSIYTNVGTAFKAPTLEHLYGSYGSSFIVIRISSQKKVSLMKLV